MKTKLIIKTTALSIVLLAWCGGKARAADATGLWEKNCASCHGKDGRGGTKIFCFWALGCIGDSFARSPT